MTQLDLIGAILFIGEPDRGKAVLRAMWSGSESHCESKSSVS